MSAGGRGWSANRPLGRRGPRSPGSGRATAARRRRRRATDDRPVVLRWADDAVVDTLLITATAADGHESAELVVHEFHLGGDPVHADTVCASGALRGLAVSPEDDAAVETLRDALGVTVLARRARVAVPLVEDRLVEHLVSGDGRSSI